VDDLAPSGRDARLYRILSDYLESVESGLRPDPSEVIGRHPEFVAEIREFLETQSRIECLAAPVRQVSREFLPDYPIGETPSRVEISPPPVGPARSARHLNPETRRFSDELAGVLRTRLIAAYSIAAVAFAMMVLVGLASPRGRYDCLRLALYTAMALWYAALLTWLVRHYDIPLSGLRVVEVLALTAYAAHSGWKDFEHYSRYWGTLGVGEQWFLVSHRCLNWVFLILIYGVLIPNNWRRSLRVLTFVACIPLAVYGATWLLFPESCRPAAPLFDLFGMARVMAAAVAINVFGAHKIITLRREAYEARHTGNYRITRLLSTGGMGEVYLAEHRLLNRPYAIKLIRPDRAADPTIRRRFEREIRAMALLTHWNTIEIFDYGDAPDGTFYYVMEYVEGLNLRELVDRFGPAKPGRVVYILRQVCAALAEAHAAGLVHRDIKPGNVMLTRRSGLADVVEVLDFGLVQIVHPSDDDETLTRTGMAVGTPGYISPSRLLELRTPAATSTASGLSASSSSVDRGRPPAGTGRMSGRRPRWNRHPWARCPRTPPLDLKGVIQRCMCQRPG
jgi:serine/threonine-protein kinase